MLSAILALLTELLPAIPTLAQDGATVFNDIAHGEGGVTKVKQTATALSTLASHAANAAATVEAAQIAATGGGAASNGGTATGPLSDEEKAQLAALQARAAASA